MYLDEVIEEVVRAARVIADAKQVAIALTTVHSAPLAGDEDLIRRLVANLLDNAVRHAPPGSTWTCASRKPATGTRCRCSDSGAGIPPENQPHIFERFYRGDAARAPADGGAGLGLALARWIASVHGGDVELAHSSPAGTTSGRASAAQGRG